jgi:hypothetical protein
VPARQYRCARWFEDLQGALDLGEPPQDALGHLERIVPLLPQDVQLVHDLVEPGIDMPPQLGELVKDRGSPRRHRTPPRTGSAVANRSGTTVAVCPRAGRQVGKQL